MRNIEVLKTVIDKYELAEDIPFAVREAAEITKKKVLLEIVKRQAGYSLFAAAAISLFLWIKRYGLTVSISKCAAAVATAAIVGASAAAVTTVYTVKKIISGSSEIREEIKDEGKNDEKPLIRKNEKSAQNVLRYSVAVSPVEMDQAPAERINTLTDVMISELRTLKGGLASVRAAEIDRNHISDKILSISVIKLEEQSKSKADLYRVSAKIVNSENSRVLIHVSETAEGGDGIGDAIRKIAKKLSSVI